MKRTGLILAALLSFGCSMTPTSNNATLLNRDTSFGSFSDGNGVVRRLDFDYVRAERLQSLRQHSRSISTQALAEKVDLRQKCSPVGDQGKLGSCTGWAMSRGLREYMQNKSGETYTQLSPLYLYYKERELNGTTKEDCGATITDGMSVLKDSGVSPEVDWPYVVAKFSTKPSAIAEKNATKYKVKSIKDLSELSEIKAELAKGNAVAFGFKVHKSFMSKEVAQTGKMPIPKPGDQLLGGHAVCAVGYDDTQKVLIVRNSWGPGWGDKGYFYMPYQVAESESMDFWTAN